MNDNESRPLPLWLKVAGTVFVAFHFLVLGAHVLSSRSGPWPSPFGQSPAEGPQFAGAIASAAFPWYLEPLRFTHDYHFNTNRVSLPEVKFEIKLYNKLGQVIDTLEFPEKTANPWVKHRLDLLAQNLAGDVPVEARQAEAIAPEKKLVSSVDIWEPTKGGAFVIRSVPQHLIPRDRPVFRPSPWASMVAASYVRYQCRLHSADSGELIRHSRDAVQPTLIFLPQLSDAAFQEMVAAFKKTKP
ncbi:MAG: hypothetical protein U0793_06750 [Gemmataceae bacterium]